MTEYEQAKEIIIPKIKLAITRTAAGWIHIKGKDLEQMAEVICEILFDPETPEKPLE